MCTVPFFTFTFWQGHQSVPGPLLPLASVRFPSTATSTSSAKKMRVALQYSTRTRIWANRCKQQPGKEDEVPEGGGAGWRRLARGRRRLETLELSSASQRFTYSVESSTDGKPRRGVQPSPPLPLIAQPTKFHVLSRSQSGRLTETRREE